MPNSTESTSSKNRLPLSLDLRLVSAALLTIIVVMLVIWQPWTGPTDETRTIQVTGQSTLSAEPDEFVFRPQYQYKNADKTAALAEITKKSNTVVEELKKLGVDDKDIKIDSSGYDFPTFRQEKSGDTTYTLSLTVTVGKLELAQKVQDYLVSTTPTGSVSPQAGFSDAKRRELENKARDEASKEARAKADQSASNLGFKIGKVKAVEDGAGFGDVMPYSARDTLLQGAAETAPSSIDVQPGQNDFNYTVTVTYYLR